jgi:D-amino-acid dehydrogenase
MVVSDEVVDIGVETGRVQWVKTLERTYATQTVVLAGGAWSKKLSRSLNYTIPVEPQRGQIIHFKVTDNSSPGLWAMMSNFGGYYFVPWPDGRVVFGATREDGSGYAPHTTLDGVHELLSEVKRVAPGLGSAELHEIRIGLRPLTQDKMPVLGRIPSVDGVLLATGHGPTGLQLGPFSGRLVADLALGRQPQVNIDPFSVTRFTSGRESMTTKH